MSTKFLCHISKSIIDLKIDYKSANYYVHDFSKLDEKDIQDSFSIIKWDDLQRCDLNCNAKFDLFLTKVKDFARCNVPRRKLSKHKLELFTKPWINNEIQNKIKFRNRLFRKMRKSGNTQIKQLYKQFRNRIVQDIRYSKKQYYSNYFFQNKNNMKKLWSGIKAIINFNDNKLNPLINLKMFLFLIFSKVILVIRFS